MKKSLLSLVLMTFTLNMQAQPPADESSTYPTGTTYTHSSGTTTLEGQTYTNSTQYENVIQVTGGTLTLNNCTYTKTGDGSNGDNSSFYGNNSSIYAGSASSTGYQSTTSASSAKLIISGGTVTSSSEGAVPSLTMPRPSRPFLPILLRLLPTPWTVERPMLLHAASSSRMARRPYANSIHLFPISPEGLSLRDFLFIKLCKYM